MARFALFIFFILYTQVVFTQSFPIEFYTVGDGLPYSQITVLYQDSKGFIWIGTKNGASKFDGKVFKNFDKRHFSNTYVTDIKEDEQGCIWLAVQKGLVKICNDEVDYFPLDFDPYKLAISSDSIIWLITRLRDGTPNAFYEFDEASQNVTSMSVEYPGLKDKEIYDLFYDKKSSRLLVATRKNGLITISRNSTIRVQSPINRLTRILIDSDSNIYVKGDTTIYTLENNRLRLLSSYPKSSHVVFQGEKHSYHSWRNNVFSISPDGTQTEICNNIPDISYLLLDRENTLWVGSEEGLIHVVSDKFIHYTKKDNVQFSNVWSVLEDEDENIWFASYGLGLSKLEDNKAIDLRNRYSDVYEGVHFYFGAIKDKVGNLLFPTNLNILKYDGTQFSILDGSDRRAYISDDFDRGVVMYIHEDTTNNLLLVGRKGLQVLKDGKEIAFYDCLSHMGMSSHYVTAIDKIREGQYWIATHSGLAKFDHKTESFKTYSSRDSSSYLPANGILSIFQDNRKNWWFGSHDGLLFYDEESDSFTRVQGKKVGGNFIHFITELDSSSLILGLDKGLAIFDLNIFYEEDVSKFKIFNSKNGFTGIECAQNSVLKDSKGNIWVSTPQLVTKISSEQLKKISEQQHYTAMPFIDKISVPTKRNKYEWETLKYANGNGKNEYERLILPRYQNNLKLDYKAINFTTPTPIQYKYRLIGQRRSSEWSDALTDEFAILTDLKPGNYIFQVMVDNHHDSSDLLIDSFSFSIQRDWKIMFSQFLALITVFFLTTYFYKRFYLKKQEREYSRKLELLRLEALQAQISPHFISNALNATQSHVYSGDIRKANQKFTMLDTLIRSFLEASKNISIPLKRELSFLKNYISFESTRYNNFIYHIQVEEPISDLSNELEVPPMFIQPFVENAIIHGFEQKREEDKGQLNIHIYRDSLDLVYEISDNGIGIEKAKKLKNESSDETRKSRGTQLINERISVLRKTKKFDITILTEDLTNVEKNISGTKVIVKISKVFLNP